MGRVKEAKPVKLFMSLIVNPVRNSSEALNPAGIILECNPATGGTAEQRDIISNGVKEEDILQRGIQDLQKEFGEIDFMSEKFLFDFTEYYTPEMGENLFRHFIAFEKLVSRDSLPGIKLTTNRLEEKHAASDGNRRINIDPGYLCMEHVILATTKAYTHRPYLGKGIYADLTLIYQNKSFQPLDWTYPDYRQEEVLRLFNQLRKKYSDHLKEGECQPC